jgi:hypothetical protein
MRSRLDPSSPFSLWETNPRVILPFAPVLSTFTLAYRAGYGYVLLSDVMVLAICHASGFASSYTITLCVGRGSHAITNCNVSGPQNRVINMTVILWLEIWMTHIVRKALTVLQGAREDLQIHLTGERR